VNVAHLPGKGLPVWLEADDAQRDALAREHGLLSVERFRFDFTLSRWQGSAVKVHGKVAADIVQACIVTLEPVPAAIGEDVDAIFVPEGSRLFRPEFYEKGELVLDAEGEDAPETFKGDMIDVGALAEEFFALAIDPYPRKEGAVAEVAPGVGPDEPEQGPLAEKLGQLFRKS